MDPVCIFSTQGYAPRNALELCLTVVVTEPHLRHPWLRQWVGTGDYFERMAVVCRDWKNANRIKCIVCEHSSAAHNFFRTTDTQLTGRRHLEQLLVCMHCRQRMRIEESHGPEFAAAWARDEDSVCWYCCEIVGCYRRHAPYCSFRNCDLNSDSS